MGDVSNYTAVVNGSGEC